jgi:hypothetical protein
LNEKDSPNSTYLKIVLVSWRLLTLNSKNMWKILKIRTISRSTVKKNYRWINCSRKIKYRIKLFRVWYESVYVIISKWLNISPAASDVINFATDCVQTNKVYGYRGKFCSCCVVRAIHWGENQTCWTRPGTSWSLKSVWIFQATT